MITTCAICGQHVGHSRIEGFTGWEDPEGESTAARSSSLCTRSATCASRRPRAAPFWGTARATSDETPRDSRW